MKTRIDPNIAKMVKVRRQDSQKGDFGTLLMLCGSRDMPGAAVLCAMGALRSGVGILELLGSRETVERISLSVPEAVLTPFGSENGRVPTAFACGCGIGRQYDGVLEELLPSISVPSVLDADCINFLAKHKDILKRMRCEKIVTPHPGEMSRLTGSTAEDIRSRRQETALEFSKEHGCITLLKGKNTVIAAPDGRVFVNPTGCSALAKGGSGDVLTGVIGSLLAQGYRPFDAAVLGAYFHGLAGDELSLRLGEHGVIPGDLPKMIGRLLFAASCSNRCEE